MGDEIEIDAGAEAFNIDGEGEDDNLFYSEENEDDEEAALIRANGEEDDEEEEDDEVNEDDDTTGGEGGYKVVNAKENSNYDILTKFEETRVISKRAIDLSNGSQPLVSDEIVKLLGGDYIAIANYEVVNSIVPMTITRKDVLRRKSYVHRITNLRRKDF
ncbi:MAG: hypothetical protein AAB966_01550 [Patescibacteria group bacterium]